MNNNFNKPKTTKRYIPWIHLPKTIYILLGKLKQTHTLTHLVLFFIGFTYCSAQTPAIDSLENKLSMTTNNLERITLYNELSDQLHGINFDKSLIYAQKALKISQKIKDKENEINTLFILGKLTYDSHKRDSAMAYFTRGEYLAQKHNYPRLQAEILMRIANWYRYYEVDSTKTVDFLKKSLSVSKANNDNHSIGRSYAKLASFYTRYKEVQLCEYYLNESAKHYLKTSGGEKTIAHYYNEVGYKIWDYNPKKSLEFYYKGLSYSPKNANTKVSIATAYNTIGEPLIALKFLEEAIVDLNEKKHHRTRGVAFAQLAETYLKLGRNEQALKVCNEGIDFLTNLSISNQAGLPSLYRSKGFLMKLNGDLHSALELYNTSLTKASEVNEPYEVVKSNITLGVFFSSKFPEKSEKYCSTALKKAKEGNFNNLEIQACDCLYKVNKKKENYVKALQFHERKVALNDSLGTVKVKHTLDINNKIVEKDKQIAKELHLKNIKEEQLKNKNRTITILFASFFLGLILILILLKSINKITKQNSEISKKTIDLEKANANLERSNEELERFAHVASHDLKSPLNNIMLCASVLRNMLKEKSNELLNEPLDYIEKSGASMKSLIDDILEYSKLSNTETEKLEHIDLNKIVNEIEQLTITNKNGGSKKIEASQLPTIKWNHPKILLLFKNLIENGLKYNTSDTPTVRLHFTKQKNSSFLYIEDNGIGIKKENYDSIFVMFKRLHKKSEYDGTGLGLATCKKIIEEFNGEITIDSTIDKGTIFKIKIPNKLLVDVD